MVSLVSRLKVEARPRRWSIDATAAGCRRRVAALPAPPPHPAAQGV